MATNKKPRTVSWLNSKIEAGRLMKNLADYGIGLSAQAIIGKKLGKDLTYGDYQDYPRDHLDLMRCVTVVDIFLIDINIMKGANNYWDAILKNWEVLTTLCRHEEFELADKMLNEILADNENKGVNT